MWLYNPFIYNSFTYCPNPTVLARLTCHRRGIVSGFSSTLFWWKFNSKQSQPVLSSCVRYLGLLVSELVSHVEGSGWCECLSLSTLTWISHWRRRTGLGSLPSHNTRGAILGFDLTLLSELTQPPPSGCSCHRGQWVGCRGGVGGVQGYLSHF